MRNPFSPLLALAVLMTASPSLLAQGPGPVVGRVQISVQSGFSTVKAGGFGEAQIAVTNASTTSAVHVVIQAWVTYSDGTVHPLGLGPGQTLPPGIGVVVFPLFVVPQGTAPGEATIHGRVFVTRVTNTKITRVPRPAVALDSAVFTVVP